LNIRLPKENIISEDINLKLLGNLSISIYNQIQLLKKIESESVPIITKQLAHSRTVDMNSSCLSKSKINTTTVAKIIFPALMYRTSKNTN